MSVHPYLLAAAVGAALIASPGLVQAREAGHGLTEAPSQWIVTQSDGAGGREMLTLSLKGRSVSGESMDEGLRRRTTIRGELSNGALTLNSVESGSGARCIYQLHAMPDANYAGRRICPTGSNPVSLDKAPQRK